MSITILAGTPGGSPIQAGQLVGAAAGIAGGIGGLAAQLIQGAAGFVPSDSVILINTNILEHHREHEYDGPNYLWTKHTIRLSAVFNPLLNSFNQNNPLALPSRQAGFKGPVSDVALRHYLAQPRRILQLYVGGQLYFQSPRAGTTVDEQNGPFPTVNNIRFMSGTKTFVVDLTFETCLNESYLFTNKPTVMLSHTYSSEHDIDQDFYTTRVIHGHAFFSTSRLMQLGARADDFRAYLFHPIPLGFHRVSIQAQVDEGGGELLYTLIDREVTHSIGAYAASRGVTRIECTHSSEIHKPDIEEQVIGSAVSLAGDVVGYANKIAGLASLPIEKEFLTTIGIAVGVNAGLWNVVRKNVPVGTQNVVCRVWGNNNSTRAGLRAVCGNILRFRTANLDNFRGATAISWLDDVRGKFVQGTLRVTQPPIAKILDLAGSVVIDGITGGLIGQLKAALAGIEALRPIFPGAPGVLREGDGEIPESIGVPGGPDGILSRAPFTFVGPPALGWSGNLSATDGNARGTYVESLVSSALLAPNQAPSRPAATPNATSRTPP